jgi:hypothetical protein
VSWSQSSPRSRGRPLVVGRFGAGLVVPALARVILCEATLGVEGYREMLAAAEQRLPAARSLLTLETRMEPCRESSRRVSRPRVGTPRRRRQPRCGWSGPCGRSWAVTTGP